jgi:hypothetical protein
MTNSELGCSVSLNVSVMRTGIYLLLGGMPMPVLETEDPNVSLFWPSVVLAACNQRLMCYFRLIFI